MTVIAGRFPTDLFSVVTIGEARRAAPSWERMFGWPADGATAVPLDVRSPGERTIWAARLDRAVREADARVLLIADGIGCAAGAWWARLSPADDVGRIAGAVLFAPQSEPGDLFASPQAPLPFPSLVIQPGESAQVHDTIAHWGSRLVVGERPRDRGQRSVAWRQTQRLFLRLTRQMVDHDVDRGQAITGWR